MNCGPVSILLAIFWVRASRTTWIFCGGKSELHQYFNHYHKNSSNNYNTPDVKTKTENSTERLEPSPKKMKIAEDTNRTGAKCVDGAQSDPKMWSGGGWIRNTGVLSKHNKNDIYIYHNQVPALGLSH